MKNHYTFSTKGVQLLIAALILVCIFSVIPVLAADDCSRTYPNPVIKFSHKDSEGRIYIPVVNWSDYPNEMFRKAPELPPCGLNSNSSRTWVNIYDADTNKYIYGFCAFSSNTHLELIWFKPSVSTGRVYIILEDRACKKSYKSNTISYRGVGDTTAPVTKVTASPSPNPAGWNNTNVTVKLTATDSGDSGVKEIRYQTKVDAGAYGPVSVSSGSSGVVAVNTEGINMVEYWAVDNAGNEELPHKTVTVKLDKTGPDTTASPDPGTDWHKGVFTLNFTADDHGRSGVGQIKYRFKVNEGAYGPEQTGDTVSFSTSGIYTVEYWSLDILDNEGPRHTITVKMDNDAPEIKKITPPLDNYCYLNILRPEFKATFSDTLSGIDTASIKLYLKEGTVSGTDFGSEFSMELSSANGNDINMTFTPDHDLAAGDYTATFKVLDRAGNEKYESRTFSIVSDSW